MSSSPLYAPLPTPTSTRVVALAPGTFGESLHATLLIIDLADLPAPLAQPIEPAQTVQHVLYEAISYTWGPPPSPTNPEKTITLSGHDISIRLNLYQCLQRLRHESQQRRFWIDALSISQTDLKEKGKQVAMIGRIFGGAEMVRVWVGEEADGSSELFVGWKYDLGEGRGVGEVQGVFQTMVNRVKFKHDYDTAEEEEEEEEDEEEQEGAEVTDDELESSSNENDQDVDSGSEEDDSSESEVEDELESEEDVNTVARDTGSPDLTKEQQRYRLAVWAAFLARPYFSRYWILQEVCIARKLRVHCGSSSLSWQQLFSRFFRQYMSMSWIWERSAKGCEVDVHSTGNWQPFSGYANRVNQVHDLRGLQRTERLRKTADSRALFTLMARFEDSECEDRRDRIYAIMSLEEHESSVAGPAFDPDYENSVPDLWLLVSEHRLLGIPFSQMDHLHDAQSVLERSLRPKSAEYEMIFELFVERCEHSTGELREQWRHMATRYVGDVVERLGKRGWDKRPGEDLEYESSVRISQKVEEMGLPVPRRGLPPNRT